MITDGPSLVTFLSDSIKTTSDSRKTIPMYNGLQNAMNPYNTTTTEMGNLILSGICRDIIQGMHKDQAIMDVLREASRYFQSKAEELK